jgi:hypothetical protein
VRAVLLLFKVPTSSTRCRLAEAALVSVVVLCACAPRPSGDGAEPGCNRICLEDAVEGYLRALVARNVSGVPLAAGATFVEDMQVLPIGSGTWTSVTGPGGYRRVVADPDAGRIAALAVVEEGGSKVLLHVILQLSGRVISRIESIVIRDAAAASRYETLALPVEQLVDTAPSPRVAKQALVAAVEAYYSAIERRDPASVEAVLAGKCERLEHGDSTSPGCRSQFETDLLSFVTRVRDRRYLVDEERQTVFALAFLDADGTVRTIRRPDGNAHEAPPYFSVPRTLQVAETFRFEGGKIRHIEVGFAEFPYGTRPPPGDGAAPGAPVSTPVGSSGAGCDRACLISVAQQWVDALATGNRANVPLAADARYTENGQQLPVGDGLWRTVTAVQRDRRIVADPGSGTVGVLAGILEHAVPGVLAARLKVTAGRLTEVEAVVARHERWPPDGDTGTLFGPRLPDAFDPARFASESLAFDRAVRAVAGLGVPEPVGTSFMRGETPRERRQLVRDASQSLALELTLTDVTGASTASASTTGPFTVLEVSLVREGAGQPVELRAVARALPYGSGSGWRQPRGRASVPAVP